MCGAPKQGGTLAGIDLDTQTVIQGQVWHDGAPVPGAYVRLLDETDEFTAEVVVISGHSLARSKRGPRVKTRGELSALNGPWRFIDHQAMTIPLFTSSLFLPDLS